MARCCPGPPDRYRESPHKRKSKTGKTRAGAVPARGRGKGRGAWKTGGPRNRKWRVQQERTGWRGKIEVRKLLYSRGFISLTWELCKHLNNDRAGGGGGHDGSLARCPLGMPGRAVGLHSDDGRATLITLETTESCILLSTRCCQ